MPTWIHVSGRSIPDVRVPVQRLRIARLRHDRVGLDETGQSRVIQSRVVIVQPDCSIFVLTCKTPGGWRRAGPNSCLTPRLVPPGGFALQKLAHFGPVGSIGSDAGTAQMVWKQVVQHAVVADRDAPIASIVVPPGGFALFLGVVHLDVIEADVGSVGAHG